MVSFTEEGHSHFTVNLGSSWKSKESHHFTVFYKEGYEKNADELISNLEYYREKVERLVGNKNPGRTFVTLHDTGIISNGYYDYLFDGIGISTYHPQQHLLSSENWYRMVGVHEYTHRMQLTNTTGFPQIFVTAFGTPFHPNLYSPSWLTEGIAVYSESRLSQYEGRLNDGNFTSYIKARAKSGEIPTLNDVTHLPLEYPQGGDYLYGSLFLEYLSLKYGEEKFSLFFSSIGSDIFIVGSIFPYFGIDRAAKRIYHKSIKELFSEWKTWEKERAKDWKMDGQRLTNYGWDVLFPILSQDKIYYVRNYPKKTGAFEYFDFEEIIERDLSSGNERVIVGLTSNVNMPLRIMNNKLYYGIFDVSMGYNSSPDGMGFISSIYERDINTGKNKLIFKDEVRSFSPISSDEIIYAKDRKDEFGSLVLIYSNKNKDKKILFNIPYLIAEILPHKEEIFIVAKKNGKIGVYTNLILKMEIL